MEIIDCLIDSLDPVHNIDHPPSIWLHLFCGAGHEKRRGEQLKWSLAFRLYIGNFPCAQLPGPVHTARLGRVCFYIYPRFVFLCVCIALICLCVPILLCFPGQLSHLPLQVLALA